MDEVLKNYVKGIVKNPNKKLTRVWENGFSSVLDSYLGKVPQEFTYKSKDYNSTTFNATLGFNPDDYIMLSSFTHHPFYKPFVLEVPDNWSWGEVYNLPLAVLEEVADYALDNGFSMVWATDYSEKGFMFNDGMAIVPRALYLPSSKGEEKKMNRRSMEECNDLFSNLDDPVEELEVTQELRQLAFDNYSTTDDHGMHIVGLAKDKNDKKYYYVKNSWGTDNMYGGYLFVSKSYFQYKTISIMLHKDAIPLEVKAKLGL